MTTKEIVISTSNREIADNLLSAVIPGIRQNEVKEYDFQPEQLFYIVISFTLGIPAGVIANMIYYAISNRKNHKDNHKTNINSEPIPDSMTEIETTIKQIIRHTKYNQTTDKQEEDSDR